MVLAPALVKIPPDSSAPLWFWLLPISRADEWSTGLRLVAAYLPAPGLG